MFFLCDNLNNLSEVYTCWDKNLNRQKCINIESSTCTDPVYIPSFSGIIRSN